MSGLRHKFDVDPALWDDANGWLVGPMRVRNNEHDGACEKGACEYVVLDLYHDPHVAPALRAYAASVMRSNPKLAQDLMRLATLTGKEKR